MSILSKIFGGGNAEAGPVTAPEEAPECAHRALVPRWDDAADMGKSDKIARYYCEGCGSEFTVEEASGFRAAPL